VLTSERFFERLRGHPASAPALQAAHAALSYGALQREIEALADFLARHAVRRLATVLANGAAWVIADLAALRAGIVHVPLPLFFTDEQCRHALQAAAVDAVLAAAPTSAAAAAQIDGDGVRLPVAGQSLWLARREAAAVALPCGTRKVTFTSGTTGQPKGVCLGEAPLAVADGLVQALAPLQLRRHLCALPLSVLLENVAGVYAPLAAGATLIVPSGREAGLEGSSSFDPAALDAAVQRHGAESVIVLPQMLRAWSAWRTAMRAAPLPALKFVAVGGAHVGRTALAQARRSGLPAFEGYGLSEGASVQTLNLPNADRPGSAGRPLPHAQLRIDAQGEVWVAGALLLGYLGAPPAPPPRWWATGDLGHLDSDGFLHLDGRRGDMLISAYGRNVSPQWVEAQLQASPLIAQAVVFGEGCPRLTALLWPAREQVSDRQLQQAVEQANARLPDYAQPARWIRARLPFTAASGMATANGRPRRAAIAAAHAAALADEQPTP
jgi:long-chain acyl-CoA synthetase